MARSLPRVQQADRALAASRTQRALTFHPARGTHLCQLISPRQLHIPQTLAYHPPCLLTQDTAALCDHLERSTCVTAPASSSPSDSVHRADSSAVHDHTASTSASIPLGTAHVNHFVPLATGYSSWTILPGTSHSSATISSSTGQLTSSVPFYPSQSSDVPNYSPSSSMPSTHPAATSSSASVRTPASSPSSYTDPNGIVYTIEWDKTCKGTVVLPATSRKREDTTTARMVGCMISCDETDGCVGVDVEDGAVCTLYSESTGIRDETGSFICRGQSGSGSSGQNASRSATISASESASASATNSGSLTTGISTTSA